MADKAASFLQLIRRDRRGRLKVYLGYSAGVGKTYEMLEEAHRLKQEGIDVVVGVVETHGRAETSRLVDGLALQPLRRQEYHGITVEEMDLEGLLARHPQVALVDELAHTNAPGSRNAKRYQDVEDLLAAGIHVITTLNVQHLESLYDMVERGTGVKVRERLPDSVLAEADQVVNVDVTPEDLQKRLKMGKIYPKERVDSALEHFFQAANLEQLRELTLREAASQIDYRRRGLMGEGDAGAADQLMVCLDARGPENAALLRYGSRLAGRLNRNWYAVYVQTLAEEPTVIDAARQRRLADTLTLANQLGATVFTLKGEDVADTLCRFAREYRVGHIIVGRPHERAAWRRWLQPREVVDRLLRLGQGFTLIVADAHSQGRPGLEITQDAASPPLPLADRFRLADHLRPETLLIWEHPVTKMQAMHGLLAALEKRHASLDVDFLMNKLLEREEQGSTFMNEGVALPHARIEGLAEPLIALGLCHGGISDAAVENPIEVVFLLLSPKDEHKSHLQWLAVAGRLMQNRVLRGRLRQADNSQAALTLLAES